MSCGFLDKTASGVSVPIDPMASLPLLHIGKIMVLKSSLVYPKTFNLVSKFSFSFGDFFTLYGILLSGKIFDFTHLLYGYFFTIEFFISSSSTILPSFILTKNILPGSSLPCILIFSGSISTTPVSDDIITYPS